MSISADLDTISSDLGAGLSAATARWPTGKREAQREAQREAHRHNLPQGALTSLRRFSLEVCGAHVRGSIGFCVNALVSAALPTLSRAGHCRGLRHALRRPTQMRVSAVTEADLSRPLSDQAMALVTDTVFPSYIHGSVGRQGAARAPNTN